MPHTSYNSCVSKYQPAYIGPSFGNPISLLHSLSLLIPTWSKYSTMPYSLKGRNVLITGGSA